MTRKEIAEIYGISIRTLYAWFSRIGLDIPKNVRITPLEYAKIKEKLGEP